MINPGLRCRGGQVCPSGKRRYLNKGTARQAVAIAEKRQGKVLYFYRCPDCRDYHLTRKGAWGRAKRA